MTKVLTAGSKGLVRGVGRTLRLGAPLVGLALVGGLLTVDAHVAEESRPGVDASVVRTAAAWETLCDGYQGCRQAGYSDGGYGAVNDRMYWNMYSGHNCVNYVAYRMIKAGAPAEKPWSGTGMAYNWGLANREITDQTPTVGAVAWWNRNTGGIGSSGHVALVERVVSSTEIIVSEDSWGGDFDWRRITKSSGQWPTGFIHFVETGTTNVVAPAVAGTPEVGKTLRAKRGKWQPRPVSSYAFQWLAGGQPIKGATEQTYTPGVQQQRERISVKVTAKGKGVDAASVVSAPTTIVAKGEIVNETAPVLTGSATKGEKLTMDQGTWSVDPEVVKYRWFADGTRLKAQKKPTMVVPGRLAGATISGEVAVRSEGYRVSTAEAGEMGPVKLGDVEPAGEPTVSGRPRLGERLTVDPGRYEPSNADVEYQWLRDGEKVPGRTGTHYDLGRADLGSRITVRVTASSPKYNDSVSTVGPEGTVTSESRLTVKATGAKGAATVRLTVRAEEVDAPGGRAEVTVAGVTRSVEVVDGTASVRLTDLRKGRHTVRVEYAGDGSASAASGTATVRVTAARRGGDQGRGRFRTGHRFHGHGH